MNCMRAWVKRENVYRCFYVLFSGSSFLKQSSGEYILKIEKPYIKTHGIILSLNNLYQKQNLL